MKNKYNIILKNSLTNTYKLKSMTKKKLLLIFILVIYVFISIFMMLNNFFGNIYETLFKMNLSHYYLTIIFSITSIFSFFFTIFSAKNALFENKDNDLLFSLPIKKKTVLLSRLSSILIYNFLIGLFIIIPGIYVYLINELISVEKLIVIIVLTLFSSAIPTILSSLFGYLIALITSKSKNKNIIELISYMAFIGIYMLAIYQGDSILKLLVNHPKLLNTILKYIFFPIYLINLSITKENIVYTIIYIIINITIIYLFITLLNKLYYKLIVKLGVQKTSTNFNMKKLNKNSPIVSLIKKEIKRYFSSPIYIFNTSFGILVLIIASIASLFYKSNELLAIVGDDLSLNSFMLVFYLLTFAIGLSVTTNSSISIERNNFWILKMLPVTAKEVLKAKKSVNLVLLIPTILLSLIIFTISGYIKIYETIFLMIIMTIFSITISNFGLICNLLFPKFDAPNDTVIIKQSLSSMMGIIIPLVFLTIYVTAINSFRLSQNLIITITTCLFIFLNIITSIILNSWGIKKYKKL